LTESLKMAARSKTQRAAEVESCCDSNLSKVLTCRVRRMRCLGTTKKVCFTVPMFTIAQPKIAEIYYTTCAAIDKHNRLRQDDLRMEKKIETKDWSTRVNLSIFSMIVVDTWLVFSAMRNTPRGVQMNQKEFYSVLAEELIDNMYGSRGRPSAQPRSSPNLMSFQDACMRALESGGPRAGVLTHLTPVKRLKNSKGEKTTFRYQGRCKECQKKTTWQCSDCDDNGKIIYLCATKNGKRCFLNHLARNHAHLDEF
jgi:hypothetical protein